MPRGGGELAGARREEIIDACAALYEEMEFREITIRDIGGRTSFTRTSIYNYFQTKEEIFLALLQREYEAWLADLERIAAGEGAVSREELAEALARSLEKRRCMLKLLSRDLSDMEKNSRLENLVAFKRVYARSLEAAGRCLGRCAPAAGEEEIRGGLFAFFPFLFGVYPYTSQTPKQAEAMRLAAVPAPDAGPYALVKNFLLRLLASLEDGEGLPAGREEREER